MDRRDGVRRRESPRGCGSTGGAGNDALRRLANPSSDPTLAIPTRVDSSSDEGYEDGGESSRAPPNDSAPKDTQLPSRFKSERAGECLNADGTAAVEMRRELELDTPSCSDEPPMDATISSRV